jgi:hypothetical protein
MENGKYQHYITGALHQLRNRYQHAPELSRIYFIVMKCLKMQHFTVLKQTAQGHKQFLAIGNTTSFQLCCSDSHLTNYSTLLPRFRTYQNFLYFVDVFGFHHLLHLLFVNFPFHNFTGKIFESVRHRIYEIFFGNLEYHCRLIW